MDGGYYIQIELSIIRIKSVSVIKCLRENLQGRNVCFDSQFVRLQAKATFPQSFWPCGENKWMVVN